jgi:hypothetical protein
MLCNGCSRLQLLADDEADAGRLVALQSDFEVCGYRQIDVYVFYNQLDHVHGVPYSFVGASPTDLPVTPRSDPIAL